MRTVSNSLGRRARTNMRDRARETGQKLPDPRGRRKGSSSLEQQQRLKRKGGYRKKR